MPPMGSGSYQNLAIANCAVPEPQVLLPVITDAFDFICYVNGIMGDVTKYESRVNEHTIHVLYQICYPSVCITILVCLSINGTTKRLKRMQKFFCLSKSEFAFP